MREILTTLILQENLLKQYFKIRPVDKNGTVFCHLNGYSATQYQFYK